MPYFICFLKPPKLNPSPEIFSRLLLLASKYNFRIIAPNRRDYGDSSSLTVDELANINLPDPVQHADFLRARGQDIANFLVYAIKKLRIHPISPSRDAGTEGGVVLIGWSMGNIATMSFVRFFRTFPQDVQDTITQYLQSLVIYGKQVLDLFYRKAEVDYDADAGYNILGFSHPAGAYDAILDPDIPDLDLPKEFSIWVSSYYSHPCYTSQAAISSCTAQVLEDLILKRPTPAETYRPSTFETTTEGELASLMDPVAGSRSERAILAFSPSTISDLTLGTFLLDHPDRNDGVILPAMNVCILYCQASMWSVQWGIRELEKVFLIWRGRPQRHRSVIAVPGGNHFVCRVSFLYGDYMT